MPFQMFFDGWMADPNVLLIHTVGAALEVAVAVILMRALYLLRSNGESPRAFASIAIMMLLASLARVVRVSIAWVSMVPLFWLDAITLTLLLIVVIYIPVVLSVRYFPIEESDKTKPSRAKWLRWAMITNAVCGVVAFVIAEALRSIPWTAFIPCGVCATSALLLGIRASLFRTVQLRQRGLLLFAWLTTMGLLGLAASLIYGYLASTQYPLSPDFGTPTTDAAWAEFCNTLIVLGMMFAFASLRLADIIVKRVTHLYIWATVALLLWGPVKSLDSFATDTIHQKAGTALLSVVIIGATLVLTPIIIRKMDAWIDGWVFQVPDFNAASEQFWRELLELGTIEEVYRAGEKVVKNTLSLAAAQIMALSELGSSGEEIQSLGPNPYFVRSDSPLRPIISSSADFLLPLFQEGEPAHLLALGYRSVRPPLTAMELSFVTRIAAEIQVRIGTLVGEEKRLERLRRENSFREEIADAELRALRAQINPHFLFNSLNTIADLSITAPEKAEEMTLRLAAVFRYVLANTDRHFISVREEIEFARNYLNIEEARFGHRLKFSFDVESSVLEEKVPTLLLQPLIENALKHGLCQKTEGGTVSVIARRTVSGFELTVSDDGLGLQTKSEESREPGTHVGLQNVRNRLETAYEGNATFTLSPRSGGGTDAIVVINREKKDLA